MENPFMRRAVVIRERNAGLPMLGAPSLPRVRSFATRVGGLEPECALTFGACGTAFNTAFSIRTIISYIQPLIVRLARQIAKGVNTLGCQQA